MSTTTLLTLEQFERIAGKLELLKGEPERAPFPQRRHMQACKRLFKPLDAAVERFRGAEGFVIGEVYFEMGYLLPATRPRGYGPTSASPIPIRRATATMRARR